MSSSDNNAKEKFIKENIAELAAEVLAHRKGTMYHVDGLMFFLISRFDRQPNEGLAPIENLIIDEALLQVSSK